jgi:Leucine Rich Repeat
VDCQLSGEFPSNLGRVLTSLQSLLVPVNTLSGTLPTTLLEMEQLAYLELHYNRFRGPIATEWMSHAWRGINLAGNSITGPIPTEIGNLVELQNLILLENKLTGPIPTEIGKMSALEGLQMYDNHLSGSVPTEVGRLLNLQTLDLSENNLTGTIPSQIGNLSSLAMLSLHTTNLGGKLPEQLYDAVDLTSLVLRNNNFTGTISESIGNLILLRDLDISMNKFTGTLPATLAHDENQQMRLFDNDFTGSVPAELCVNADGGLETLSADCNKDPTTGQAEVSCSCCTVCCDADGSNCMETDIDLRP